ncbi:hypothetical protein Taro_014997 [Colocasia esculenta]|uniref:Uncharacterized protein n=1 Tax=Colocasia esculenta TaxID=4460 RepID=A0A843UNL5_COLES|nr:hypothetical protein [Colocasia esculenta]
MFRNKILVRARPPFSSSSSPFLLLQLRLDLLPSPSSPMSTISDPGSSADSCLFVKIEALCWKLSRAWGVACMCFPQSPDINVVYQRPQSESVDHVVRAIAKELPIDKVGPEEELAPSSLVVKAHECALRCAFLDRSWRCLGNSLFVDSDFSCNDERSHDWEKYSLFGKIFVSLKIFGPSRFPSAFVLQGSSLAPAPQTSRIMKAVSALDSFVKIIEGWNLFGQGLLIVQVASSFTIGSELFTWTKAADAVKICVSRNPIHSATNETISTEMSAFTDLISANGKQVCKTHLLSSSPGKTTGNSKSIKILS